MLSIKSCITDIAISRGEHDVKRVLDRQKRMEEAQTLQKFINKGQELDEDINREIEELNMMTENCEVDIGTIGKYYQYMYSLLNNQHC